MKDCQFCGHERRNCSCPNDPQTGGIIDARAIVRAYIALQRLGIKPTPGDKRPDVARKFSTGRLDIKSTGP